MRTLVTGSTGFIGYHLTKLLVDNNHQVSCLIRPKSNPQRLKELNVQLIKGDFQDVESLKEAVSNQDYVFHIAGVIDAKNWDAYYLGNCVSTKNLLSAVEKYNPRLKKFLHMSSISVSGPGVKGQIKTEKDFNLPNSLYGKSKLIAEEAVLKYKDTFPIVIIRPPNVLGGGQKELLDGIKMVKNRLLPTVGNGEIQTSIIYVGDLVDICLKAIVHPQSKDNTYFISHPTAYAWKDITQEIAKQLGKDRFMIRIPFFVQYLVAVINEFFALFSQKPASISREKLRMARDFYWIYNSSKIQRDLGLAARTTLRGAIKNTLAYYQKQDQV